jgi:hypothetical protein
VALFIDSHPFRRWVDNTRTPPIEHWSIRVPIFVSAVGAYPLVVPQPQWWVVDLGFSGEAFAWRHHLEAAGLDPDTQRSPAVQLRSSVALKAILAPIRRADLWLASTIPHQAPLFLPVRGGIAFLDQRVKTPDPELHRALVGMRPLIRAGLKLEIDFANCTFSLWTP